MKFLHATVNIDPKKNVVVQQYVPLRMWPPRPADWKPIRVFTTRAEAERFVEMSNLKLRITESKT